MQKIDKGKEAWIHANLDHIIVYCTGEKTTTSKGFGWITCQGAAIAIIAASLGLVDEGRRLPHIRVMLGGCLGEAPGSGRLARLVPHGRGCHLKEANFGNDAQDQD